MPMHIIYSFKMINKGPVQNLVRKYFNSSSGNYNSLRTIYLASLSIFSPFFLAEHL